MVYSNDIEREVEEIKINVPWGHVACKWWGSKAVRPIVCLHGWQDNSGSFDPLIYQLPAHLSYLAVDLPGHGLSSRIPDGMMYSVKSYFYFLILICEHFQWDKVSLIGHSLGSVLSYLFASVFPDKCDMVVGFDTLRPHEVDPPVIYQEYSTGLQELLKGEIRNREGTEPPSYEYEDLFSKIGIGLFMEISKDAAPYVLQRGIRPSKIHPDKYYFSRDGRLKALYVPMMANDASLLFAESIVAPYCFIKTSRGPMEDERCYNQVMDILQRNPSFEVHNIDGNHHVHLNEPYKVSGIVSTFINKFRPPIVSSKL